MKFIIIDTLSRKKTSFLLLYIFQVWFQNRRAKWRKQEKILAKQELQQIIPNSHQAASFSISGQPTVGIVNMPGKNIFQISL